MSITPRCNVAGPLGKLIPTRSLAFSLLAQVRELIVGRPRRGS
jgi:hypothetical protein